MRGPVILIFDLDDTLVPTAVRYSACQDAFGRYVHDRIPEVSPESATALVARINLESVLRGGGYGPNRFSECFVAALDLVCREHGRRVLPGERDEMYELGTEPFRAPYDIFPGVRDMLLGLRDAGHLLGLCTKGLPEVQVDLKIRHNGLEEIFHDVDGVFPLRKGQDEYRQVHDRLLRLAGERNRQGWAIGDSMRDDIVGGHQAGLNTVWISGVNHGWAYNEVSSPIEPTHVIPHVLELPEVLAGTRLLGAEMAVSRSHA